MATVQLPVVRFEQKPGLCGAATAQMILFFKGLVGNQPADQDALWALIQGNTGGVRPPSPPATIDGTDCPTWATQDCVQCEGVKTFTCWCTSPPALWATLATDYHLPMALTTPASDAILTAAVVASIGFNIPAAALAFNGSHWVAVSGFETDGPNPQLIGTQNISAVYICNPSPGASNHSVSIQTWMDDYSSPVAQCGGFLNKLVVIAATGPLVAPQPIRPIEPFVRHRLKKPKHPIAPWKKKRAKKASKRR